MAAADYASWVFGLLELLKLTDDSFSNFYLIERYDCGYKSADVGEDEFGQLVFANLQRDLTYINPASSEKGVTDDSLCALGFATSFTTSEQPNASSFLLDIRIGKSAPNTVNTLVIRCPESCSNANLIKLLRALIQYSDPMHTHCWSQAFGERINQPIGDIYIGWITYMTDSRAVKLLTGVATVSPFGKGILIDITDQKAFSMDDQVIRNALVVVERLSSIGLLINPRRRKVVGP